MTLTIELEGKGHTLCDYVGDMSKSTLACSRPRMRSAYRTSTSENSNKILQNHSSDTVILSCVEQLLNFILIMIANQLPRTNDL